MTALEAEALGVRILVTNGKASMLAPPGAVDVVERVRQEVARRVSVSPMAVLARVTSRVGTCVTCSDPLPAHRGGMCPFCLAASLKFHDSKRKATP